MDALLARAEPAGSLLSRVVPSVDEPSKAWHTSALVDLSAYQLGWLWILIPLALSGDRHPRDYMTLWAVGMSISFLHRHYTMPYVYLDRQVFEQHRTRFSLFMAWLMLGFVGSALMGTWRAGPGFLRPADASLALSAVVLVVQIVIADRRGHRFGLAALVAGALPFVALVGMGIGGLFSGPSHEVAAAALALVMAAASVVAGLEARRSESARARSGALVAPALAGVLAVGGALSIPLASRPLNTAVVTGAGLVGIAGAVAALWNVWHTLMQKFGILRMYAAKSAVPVDARAPAWVDRLLVFGSFPVLALYLAPSQRGLVSTIHKNVTQFILPLLDGLTAARPYLLAPAALLSLGSMVTFLGYEWRANRLRSTTRLTMALSLVALNACFLFLSPIKVYIAYGFSHAIEYCVFVWAFLRRRYAKPQPARPLIQRVLAHPWLAYGSFSLVVGGTYFFATYGRDFHLHDGRIRVLDVGIQTWMFAFTIWHSMAHFYYDGFLWKMRAPELRASL
jgi:hypothetical protein